MATEYYQADIYGTVSAQRCLNTLRFKGDGVTANDTLAMSEQLIQDIFDELLDFFLALLPAEYMLLKIVAKRFAPVGSAAAKRIFANGDMPGAVGAAPAAGQVCPAVRLIPTMGGLSVGRIFLPTIPVTMLVNNAFTAPYLTAIDDFFGAATTPFGGATPQWNLVINSGTHPGDPKDVVGWNVSPRIGFQRHRIIPL